MKASWLVGVVLVAVVGCKDKKKEADPAQAAKPTTEPAAAPAGSAAPATDTPAPAAPATDTPAPAAPAAGSSLAGPFASLDAYCKAATAKFVKKDCESMMDQGANVCACAAATKDDLSGPFAATATGGAVTEAAIVRVASAAADLVHCGIAVKRADGWHVHEKAFACGAAPMAHDGAMNVEIASFKITRDGANDIIELSGTTRYDTQDIDDSGNAKDVPGRPEPVAVRCEVTATSASCK